MTNTLEHGHIRAEPGDQRVGVDGLDRVEKFFRRCFCRKEIGRVNPIDRDVEAEVGGCRVRFEQLHAAPTRW
jgi:hypothetical protein